MNVAASCPWSHYAPASISFCEERICAWIVEPSGAWSNLAYVVVGIVILLRSRRAMRTFRAVDAVGVVALLIGFCSFAFHATGTRIGETLDERNANQAERVLDTQLTGSLAKVTAEQLKSIVVAYEPVWAIGTGVNASPTQAAEVQGYLRGLLSELASKEIAQTVRILYGGSVKAENAEVLLAEPEVDGALVGGASLNAQSFIGIVRKAARIGTASKE